MTKKKTTKKAATKSAATKEKGSPTTKQASENALTVAGGNDLATITEGELFDVALTEDSEDWGASFDLEENAELYKNDFLIPKVWLAQKMSAFLGGPDNIQPGDYVNSLTQRKICGPEDGLNFVVVKSFKRWQAFRVDEKGKKHYEKEYSGIMTLDNANWKYEEVIDGKQIIRSQVNSFIVLLEQDLIDNNPQAYCIDFTRSSRQGGRKLVTSLKTNTSKTFKQGEKSFRLPGAAFAFTLTAYEWDFEDGDCFCKDVKYMGMSNKSAVQMAKEIYDFIKNNEDQIEFDDRDVLDDDTAGSTAQSHDVTSKVAGTSDI